MAKTDNTARDAQIMKLWQAGDNSSVIAGKLSLTRSAVMGAVSRNGGVGQKGVAPKPAKTSTARPVKIEITLPAGVAAQLDAMRAAASLHAKRAGRRIEHRTNAALAASIVAAVLHDDALAHGE